MVKPTDTSVVSEWYDPSDMVKDEKTGAMVPAPDATRFLIGTLSRRERAHLQDAAAYLTEDAEGKSVVDVRTGSFTLKRVQFGLRGIEGPGWDGVWKEEKHPLGDDRMVPTMAVLDRIPDEVFGRLDTAVDKGSKVSEDDAGKSEPQSGPRLTSDSPATADTATP